MKKITYILASTVVAMGVASCDINDVENMGGKRSSKARKVP